METNKLNPTYIQTNPKTLTLLDKNARYMTKPQYQQLVHNIQKDGALTSTPLVWNDKQTGKKIVLSGNHRVMAAIDAGLTTIGILQIDEPLDRQRQIALQLSHNAIEGQDDPAVLKELFEEIESVEWKEFAGLDDKTLELLEQVQLETFSEAPLDLRSIQIMFTPTELERATEAIQNALELGKHDQVWMARHDQFTRLVDALDTARFGMDVKAAAVAFDVILDVFEDHVRDLAEGWTHSTSQTLPVPVSTVLGFTIPAPLAQALQKKVKEAGGPEQFLEGILKGN